MSLPEQQNKIHTNHWHCYSYSVLDSDIVISCKIVCITCILSNYSWDSQIAMSPARYVAKGQGTHVWKLL